MLHSNNKQKALKTPHDKREGGNDIREVMEIFAEKYAQILWQHLQYLHEERRRNREGPNSGKASRS